MSTNTNNSSQISGFYYDWQLNNPLLTATLHTNTRLVGVKTGTEERDVYILGKGENPYEMSGKFIWELWKPLSGAKDSSQDKPEKGEVYCLEPLTHNYSLAYDENPSACYRAKPLITSILNEDFQFEIGNAWSDNGGQTGIESAFNSLKTLAPYKKEFGAATEALGGALKDFFGKKDGTGFANWTGDKLKSAGKAIGAGADALNSSLIQQGTRFSYYGGTSTSFGNLSMRFTLFADWIWDEEKKDWIFKTVHDQLREIYPYTVGKYYPIKLGLDKNILKNNSELANDIDEVVGDFFGWQQPPAGFQADMRSLDTCQRGTLRLILGGYYTAENLLIDRMSVNFSKTMTKIPPYSKTWVNEGGVAEYNGSIPEESDDQGKTRKSTKNNTYSGKSKRTYKFDEMGTGENEITPLYADVTISLRPASSYSDTTIINFSSNNGRGRINRDLVKLRNDALQKEIQKKQEKVSELARMNKNIEEDRELYRPPEEEEDIPLNAPSSQYNTGQDVMWGKNGDIFGGGDIEY